jgi:hypothetical protein
MTGRKGRLVKRAKPGNGPLYEYELRSAAGLSALSVGMIGFELSLLMMMAGETSLTAWTV